MPEVLDNPPPSRPEPLRDLLRFDDGPHGYNASRWRLSAEADGDAPRVVALHGFAGTGANFASIARHAQGSFELVAPDLLGHGASDAPDAEAAYRLEAVCSMLDALRDTFEDDRPTVLLGFEMGGRLALRCALERPESYAALVLLSTHPGRRSSAARAERADAERRLARRIERRGVEALTGARPGGDWSARLDAPLDEVVDRRRREQRAAGLAGALRGFGVGALAPVWHRMHELQMPALLVTGADDERHTRAAFWMNLALARSWARSIPHAGAAVHLEAPVQTTYFLRDWLCGRGLLAEPAPRSRE
jgi:2-succinyl-6-hydroxy-2,4-cyclohexadiene-1-carboxylate synthase